MKNIFKFALCVFLAGCFLGSKSANLDEEFTLKTDEVIRISGTDLQIKAGGYSQEIQPRTAARVCKYKLIYGGIARHVESLPGNKESFGSFTISTRNSASGLCSFVVRKG